METNKILEGKKTDNLEATSASETTPVEQDAEEGQPEIATEPIPELNSSPSPTEEEVENANISVEPEKTVEGEEGEEVAAPVEPVAPESDQPVVSENVAADEADTNLVHEENGVVDTPALKTFTQEQVNDMVGNTRTETREKTFRYIYDRYGVADENGLDELVGNAQRYDSLQEQYNSDKKMWKDTSDARDKELADIKEQVALMQSGIDSQRYEDAKFILRGKGLEVSLDNIKAELATHPEWQKQESAPKAHPEFAKVGEPNIEPQDAEPVSKISVLGNDNAPKSKNSEEDYVLGRMFKV